MVRAAGVVVLRNRESAPEVLVVHRPHRSDWSLPKGKVDPGEQLLETAVRECIEETGLTVNLGAPLARQSYIALGRPKTVDYWVGTIRTDAGFSPDQEIDEIRWIPVADASTVLTYAHDHALVLEALALPNTSPLVILRHAKAVKRSEYDGEIDALRPLTGKGRHQTQALTAVLGAYGITAVHTSTSTRCAETVIEWIADCLVHMRNNGRTVIQSTPGAEEHWTEYCYNSVKGLIIEDMRDSWFFGSNNPDNKVEKRFLLWAGSVPDFNLTYADVAAQGYRGFEIR